MSDFLKYWDTRIDANERFFNNYPHIANFAFSECQKLWDRMEEKNKALLARHNALMEAVTWEMECRDMKLKMYRVKKAKSFHNAVHSLYALRDAARAEVDRLIAEVEG